MAGSLAWYKYIDDQDKVWGVQLDEDLGGLVGAGFAAVGANDDLETMPRGMKMRGVNAVQTSGAGAGYVSRFWACGSRTSEIYVGTTKTFTVNNQTYSTSSSRGESKRKPKSVATGQTGKSSVVGGGGSSGG